MSGRCIYREPDSKCSGQRPNQCSCRIPALQATGWAYHAVPQLQPLNICLFVCLERQSDRERGQRDKEGNGDSHRLLYSPNGQAEARSHPVLPLDGKILSTWVICRKQEAGLQGLEPTLQHGTPTQVAGVLSGCLIHCANCYHCSKYAFYPLGVCRSLLNPSS